MSMHPNRTTRHGAFHAGRGLPVAALLAAMLLTACGGGGGDPGRTGLNGGSASQGGVIVGGSTGTGSTGTGSTSNLPAAATAVQFVMANPADKSIVLQGQGGNGRSEIAVLTYKVVDAAGNPVAKAQVNFTTTSTDVKLNAPSGITGTDGLVTTSVSSMTKPTTFRVQAKLANPATAGADISSMSDTITVTTGVAVQRAFSISVTRFNVDGLNFDSGVDTPASQINLMIADAFGNPVADGTPVVFQTNLGSIGTSDRGGCVTKNGGCSAGFRTQDPRVATPGLPVTPCNSGPNAVPDSVRAGIATVCASSTDGTSTPLVANAYITMSGANAGYVVILPDGKPQKVDPVVPIDAGKLPAQKGGAVAIEVTDVLLNSMPAGTTITLLNPQGLTVVGSNTDTVPDTPVDPTDATSPQGSIHSFLFTGPNQGSQTCAASDATFTMEVKIPRGIKTTIPFKLAFTCP